MPFEIREDLDNRVALLGATDVEKNHIDAPDEFRQFNGQRVLWPIRLDVPHLSQPVDGLLLVEM
jgi:hypothetical protein